MAPAPLAAILAGELAALREFVTLLQEEQSALLDGKGDGLAALVEKKSALAGRLTDCAGQREAALAGLGLPAGRDGMEAWLATAAAAARNDWQELLPLAATARNLNELNGKLIGTRLQHNQQALAALMGATERAMTYGPDGHAHPPAGSGRSRGSA